jgi:ribosomal protein S18 acetylase RimI-like enzyme
MSKFDSHSPFASGSFPPTRASDVRVRRATKADAGDVAVLINIATHGLFADLWSREEGPSASYSSIELGRRKVLDDGDISWRHANVAELDGETVGLMLGYPEPPLSFAPVGDTYAELAAETGGGWHISKVAVHAHWRGLGVAARLLEAADERRREAGEP